jgi:hypothetical protein
LWAFAERVMYLFGLAGLANLVGGQESSQTLAHLMPFFEGGGHGGRQLLVKTHGVISWGWGLQGDCEFGALLDGALGIEFSSLVRAANQVH